MEQKICQSCGMPMVTAEEFGTNSDGSANTEYCVYCWKDGKFTVEATMDEMIARYAEFPDALKDENGNSITKEQFIANMKLFLPTLKRWKSRFYTRAGGARAPRISGLSINDIKNIKFINILSFIITLSFFACNNNEESKRVYFSIKPENRYILIPVQINDSIIANMTFDTGNPTFTLDYSFCDSNYFNPALNPPDTIIEMGAGWKFNTTPGFWYNKPQSVKIGNVNLTYEELRICHWRSYMNFEDTDVEGIFGIPHNDTTHVWELNFENNYLEIHSATSFKMPQDCFLTTFYYNKNEFPFIQFPLKIKNSDGDTLTIDDFFLVDIGISHDFTMVYPTEEELDFFSNRSDAVWVTSNGNNYHIRHIVNATLLDNFTIDSLRVYTLDNPRRIGFKYLLGLNFLKRFNIFFDLKNRQIGLQPINNYHRFIDTNFRRFYFSKNRTSKGKILVNYVGDYKDNPYKMGGLQEGDEYYEINDILFKDLTLEQMLEFEKADTLKCVFLRNGEKINLIVPIDKIFDRIVD